MERDWHFSPGLCNISVETLNRRRRAGDSHSQVSSCSVVFQVRQFTELDIFFKFTRRLFCELIQDRCGRALKYKDSQDCITCERCYQPSSDRRCTDNKINKVQCKDDVYYIALQCTQNPNLKLNLTIRQF